jgi:regulator of nucleoside diphosphate kinase
MPALVRSRSVPNIIVSNADYERLTDLANASIERLPEVAEELLSEMDRANVVHDGSVPADVVRMGSTVTFRSDDGRERTETLVYPVDEDSDAHKILGDDAGRCGADRSGRGPVDFMDGARWPPSRAHCREGQAIAKAPSRSGKRYGR